MKLLIEKLSIKNFKGIKEQEIEFHPEETTICGDNGAGKTTVVDAFNWLLFEKDSEGRSQFEIKTLENGKVIHGLDHQVEGLFKVDGRPLKLRKLYKEIWSKRNGEDQRTFTGHKVERFINDVPVTKTDFDKRIGEIVDEDIFQLLTDPRYFSLRLHWTERRKALFELAGGEVTKEDVFGADPRLKDLEYDLEDKTIEELKEALRYQRNQTNKDRENIPVKIDTLHGTIKEIDKEALETRIRSLKGSIGKIEDEMLDATKLNDEMLKTQDSIFNLRTKAQEIEHEVKSSSQDLGQDLKAELKADQSRLTDLKLRLSSAEIDVERTTKEIEKKEIEVISLRKDYEKEMKKEVTIDPDIKECPTCKREFDQADIDTKVAELEGNFKESQVKTLTKLRDRGQEANEDIARLEERLDNFTKSHEEIVAEVEALTKAVAEKEKAVEKIDQEKPNIEKMLLANPEYQMTLTAIRTMEAKLANRNTDDQIKELREKKAQLEAELKEEERNLHQEQINQQTKTKIEDLMAEETELSQKLNDIERKQKLTDDFISSHARLIENMINEKFEFVSFRLFREQTNGGLDETCEALVDGVPFDNANTAGQINAGLDIINSLCQHYNTLTPIFIDNRESINELIPTESQLVNLKVTKHKTLRIEK